MSIARTGPSRPLRSPCVALVLTVFSALALGACGGTTSAGVATPAPAAKAGPGLSLFHISEPTSPH